MLFVVLGIVVGMIARSKGKKTSSCGSCMVASCSLSPWCISCLHARVSNKSNGAIWPKG